MQPNARDQKRANSTWASITTQSTTTHRIRICTSRGRQRLPCSDDVARRALAWSSLSTPKRGVRSLLVGRATRGSASLDDLHVTRLQRLGSFGLA